MEQDEVCQGVLTLIIFPAGLSHGLPLLLGCHEFSPFLPSSNSSVWHKTMESVDSGLKHLLLLLMYIQIKREKKMKKREENQGVEIL